MPNGIRIGCKRRVERVCQLNIVWFKKVLLEERPFLNFCWLARSLLILLFVFFFFFWDFSLFIYLVMRQRG